MRLNTVIFNLGVPLLAGFVLLGTLLGCSSKKNGWDDSMASAQKTSLTYELGGEDKDGQTCNTGLQSFPNKRALCMGLQDEKLNQGCALEQRKAKFISDCQSGRDGYFVAKSCSFEVVSLKTQESIFFREMCAGRRRDGGLRVADKIFIGEGDVRINASIKMTTPGKPLDGHTLEKKLRLKGYNIDNSQMINAFEDYNMKTNIPDSDYQLIIECAKVWSCNR